MKRALFASMVVSLLGLPQGAFAAAKFDKKSTEIQANQTGITKPTQKAEDKKARPEIRTDDVFSGVGEKVKSVTDQQIKVLQRLIDNTSDTDPDKPDLLFRMGELYREQFVYYDFRARELDEKVFAAQNANNNGLANDLKAKQADYTKRSRAWLVASAKAFVEVADHPEKYGKFKRMDEVLFGVAYLLTQAKKEDVARKYFKRLITDYPKSKYIPNAFFAFADYFFENKQFEEAIKFYDKVLQFPDNSLFGFAKYKEGWVYYNLGDFKQSLATFVSVIELAEKPTTPGSKAGKLQLAREAKKDSVRAYARVGTPDKAYDFFKRIGGTFAMTMMEQLADLYNAQGQFNDSIKVYRNLMVLEPNSPKLCYWQNEVTKNTLSSTGSRATPDTVKELQRLGAVYEKIKDNKALKKDQIEECRDNTANTLRELATVWHKEAQRTGNNDTYVMAQHLYKEYLTRFPKEKDVYVMTYYYGELLWTLGRTENQKYCEAAPTYTKVVEMDPKPEAKYLKDAAYAAVLAWKNCLQVEEGVEEAKQVAVEKRKESAAAKQQKSGKKKGAAAEPESTELTPRPIPDRWKQMIGAFDTYIKYVPVSDELPKIKWNKARIFYQYNHFDDAITLLRDLAEHHAASEIAPYATVYLFDCLAAKKRFDDLQQAIDQFCPVYAEKDAVVKNQCSTLAVQLTRMRIEAAKEQGKFKEAAALYMEAATNNPNDPKVDELYYNAALLYNQAKLIGSAIKARQALLKAKPDSQLAKKAIYYIGQNYQDVAMYEQAAESYEQYAEKYPGEKDAPLALRTASFFRQGLGDNEKAIKDVELFVKDFGSRREFVDKAAGVAFDQGQIFEQQKDYPRLLKHFQDYLKTWGAKGGVDRQVVAQVQVANLLWRQSCPLPNGGYNDACIEVQRTRAGGKAKVEEKEGKKGRKKRSHGADIPAQCGPETKSKIIVHARKPNLVKEAMGHYAEAVKLYRGGAANKSVPGKDEDERKARVASMDYFAAEARFREGDQEYERFLMLNVPDKLDFSPAPPGSSPAKEKAAKKKSEESAKKLKTWLDSKGKQLEVARKVYQAVIMTKQAHWVIAAAARIGLLYQDFSGQLYTAPVPKAGGAPAGLPQREWDQMFHDAYCDQMVDVAEPIEAKAIEGLSTCLSKSTELSFYDEWSQLCEAELNQIKPVEYPLASEIRAQPGYVQVTLDRAQVQPLESK